jgi:hypothetical protein
MADFAPPPGPPPPSVPEGWKAVFNDQYKEWYRLCGHLYSISLTLFRFYVNTYTKKSQWDRPTMPAQGGSDETPPDPPPGYSNTGGVVASDHKKTEFNSNNPYNQSGGTTESDAQLAARLQAEEEARARGATPGGVGERGLSDTYYGAGSGGATYGADQSGYAGDQGQLPPREEQSRSTGSRGFLGKLLGKDKHHPHPPQQGYPPQGYGGGYPPQGYGGGYPPQGYGGGYPPQGYGGGYPPQGYGGGYPPQGYGGGYAQQPSRGGGMGAMGAGALGLGGGLLGGVLLADAFDGGGDGGGDDGGGGGDDGGGGGDF